MANSSRSTRWRYCDVVLLTLSLMVVQKLQPHLNDWVDFAIIRLDNPATATPAPETRADCPWQLVPRAAAAFIFGPLGPLEETS